MKKIFQNRLQTYRVARAASEGVIFISNVTAVAHQFDSFKYGGKSKRREVGRGGVYAGRDDKCKPYILVEN